MSYPWVIDDPKVLAWRRSELERVGYTADQAEDLAIRGDVDLHRACELLRQGCDKTVAFEILF
jgi:hypothetical protein